MDQMAQMFHLPGHLNIAIVRQARQLMGSKQQVRYPHAYYTEPPPTNLSPDRVDAIYEMHVTKSRSVPLCLDDDDDGWSSTSSDSDNEGSSEASLQHPSKRRRVCPVRLGGEADLTCYETEI